MAEQTTLVHTRGDGNGDETGISLVYDDVTDDLLRVLTRNARPILATKVYVVEIVGRVKTEIDTVDGRETDLTTRSLKVYEDREGVTLFPVSVSS